MARLERSIGARLFHRTTRKLSLTDVGQIYHSKCALAFSTLRDTEDQIANITSTPRGKVRLLAPAEHGLTSKLIVGYLKKYPDVYVDCTLTDAPPNMVEAGYDIALHVGAVTNLSLTAFRLFESSFVIVASPGYIKRHGVPKTISDLSSHHCVVFGGSSSNSAWNLAASGPLKPVPVRGRVAVNHIIAVREAVVAGLGLGLIPKISAKENIERGELEEVLPHILKETVDISLTWLGGRLLAPSVRAFIDHAKSEFKILAEG